MHDWDDDRIYQRACMGLSREGFDVHLVATRPDEEPVSTVKFHWVEKREGWRRRWYSSLEAVNKAIEVEADIYHFHDPDLLPHVSKIKSALPNCKVIYDIHENYTVRFEDWGLPAFVGRWFRNYEIRKIKKIDGFSVVSDSMAKLFDDSGKPYLVIRNSTDISRLSELDLETGGKFKIPTIYTSGSNSTARNCLQTVQALKYLDKDLNMQMMFVGRYLANMDKQMLKQANQDQTSNKLVLEGMMDWEQNFFRTAKAYAGCVFYEDNPNNRVGIPNRLFEYMYCGIPIIASDFPELRKVVESSGCGILIDSENPEAIAGAIETLLNNPSMASEMGKKGRKALEETYAYHNDLKKTIDFYLNF
jgi:glycosyltransferase involved in cell wall biosynthesis